MRHVSPPARAMNEITNFQTELFADRAGPAGFRYGTDIIAPKEEAELVRQIQKLPLAEFRFQQFLAKRLVIYFGWLYDFETSRFEPAVPIPEFLLEARSRAAEFAGLAADDLPHALVTEYAPGV